MTRGRSARRLWLPWQVGKYRLVLPHSGKGLCLEWPAKTPEGKHQRRHFVRIYIQ